MNGTRPGLHFEGDLRNISLNRPRRTDVVAASGKIGIQPEGIVFQLNGTAGPGKFPPIQKTPLPESGSEGKFDFRRHGNSGNRPEQQSQQNLHAAFPFLQRGILTPAAVPTFWIFSGEANSSAAPMPATCPSAMTRLARFACRRPITAGGVV